MIGRKRKPTTGERRTFFLGMFVPTFFSLLMAIVGFAFRENLVGSSYGTFFVAFVPCIVIFTLVIYGVSNPTFSDKWALLLLALDVVVLILVFAIINSSYGMNFSCDETENCMSHDIWDGLYFSIVTFTTLGYGDFQPRSDLRLYAALQSLMGYTVLGIMVTFGMDMLRQSHIKNDHKINEYWSFLVWVKCSNRLSRLRRFKKALLKKEKTKSVDKI